MKTTQLVSLCVVGASVMGLQAGCGCGIGAVPTGDAGPVAYVNSAGVVVFDSTPAGVVETYAVTVKDSADTDETILSASFSGSGASSFSVLSTFPIAVPAGTTVQLDLQFAPTSSGNYSAELNLQTKDMGISPVQVQGSSTGTGADAG